MTDNATAILEIDRSTAAHMNIDESRTRSSDTDNRRALVIRLPRLRRVSSRRPSRVTRRIAGAAVTLVLVVLVVVDCALWSRHANHAALESARREALNAARASVPHVIGYDYHEFDADAAAAVAATTGGLNSTLGKLEQTIKAQVLKQRVVKKATITADGVVSATKGSVDLLMFVQQATTVNGGKANAVPARLKVTMTKVGGRWLVANITPV